MEEIPNTASQSRGPGRPTGAAGRGSGKPEPLAPKKRFMSAEGKARIAAAQKKRWAKTKQTTASHANKSLGLNRGVNSKPSKAPISFQTPKKIVATSKKAKPPAAKKVANAVKRPAEAAAAPTPITE